MLIENLILRGRSTSIVSDIKNKLVRKPILVLYVACASVTCEPNLPLETFFHCPLLVSCQHHISPVLFIFTKIILQYYFVLYTVNILTPFTLKCYCFHTDRECRVCAAKGSWQRQSFIMLLLKTVHNFRRHGRKNFNSLERNSKERGLLSVKLVPS